VLAGLVGSTQPCFGFVIKTIPSTSPSSSSSSSSSVESNTGSMMRKIAIVNNGFDCYSGISSLQHIAKDCDLLIHNTYFLMKHSSKALALDRSTTQNVAQAFHSIQPKQMIINHFADNLKEIFFELQKLVDIPSRIIFAKEGRTYYLLNNHQRDDHQKKNIQALKSNETKQSSKPKQNHR
jgi:precorrin-6B methylase 1